MSSGKKKQKVTKVVYLEENDRNMEIYPYILKWISALLIFLLFTGNTEGRSSDRSRDSSSSSENRGKSFNMNGYTCRESKSDTCIFPAFSVFADSFMTEFAPYLEGFPSPGKSFHFSSPVPRHWHQHRFYDKVFYVIGKGLSGVLSCIQYQFWQFYENSIWCNLNLSHSQFYASKYVIVSNNKYWHTFIF